MAKKKTVKKRKTPKKSKPQKNVKDEYTKISFITNLCNSGLKNYSLWRIILLKCMVQATM
jgi:hypothetical protein